MCGLTDDEGAVAIPRPRETISAAEAVLRVDEDDDGALVGALLAAGGAADLVRVRAAALGDYDLSLLEELVGQADGFVEAAGVAAEFDERGP